MYIVRESIDTRCRTSLLSSSESTFKNFKVAWKIDRNAKSSGTKSFIGKEEKKNWGKNGQRVCRVLLQRAHSRKWPHLQRLRNEVSFQWPVRPRANTRRRSNSWPIVPSNSIICHVSRIEERLVWKTALQWRGMEILPASRLCFYNL